MSNYGDVTIKSTSRFLKIEPGTTYQIRLLGDAIENLFHGFGKDATKCTGDMCSFCSKGDMPKQRFKTNVYCHNFGKVMLWEYSPGIGRTLKEIAKNLANDKTDITEVDIKVSATGSGMQKKYTVMPWMPAKPLPENLVLLPLQGDFASLHDLIKKPLNITFEESQSQ